MKVYVIHGAPCSGKNTYVKTHKGDNDIIYDYDALMMAISGGGTHDHNDNLSCYILDMRDVIIARLKVEEQIDRAWIISTYVTEKLKGLLAGLNPVYKEIKANKLTCLSRLKENPDGRDVDKWTAYIESYFNKSQDNSSFYQSKAWKEKRVAILKRDDYMCMMCKRYGKAVDAKEVHHINPLNERYDLKLNNNNLISLCRECHDKCHNKYKDVLSKAGEELRRRTNRAHRFTESPLSRF